MTSNIETVKKINDAAMKKDFESLKSFLHPKYTFKDPTIQLNSVEEFIDFMENCPSAGSLEISTMIEQDNKVIQIIDCKITEPSSYTMHMCDILEFKDGKLFREEAIYDTATVPKEIMEISQKASRKKTA